MTPLFTKLNIGTHQSILVLNSPKTFDTKLTELEGIAIHRRPYNSLSVHFGIAFATTKDEQDSLSGVLVTLLSGGDAILWMAYPKMSSKNYQCEFKRDNSWDVLSEAGFEPVRQVSIDADWSALRFRREENMRSITRSRTLAIFPGGKRSRVS